jgi:hypothetical protein
MKKENKLQNDKTKEHYRNIRDKYLNAAKECNALGDKVMAEYNAQFAEHYTRVIKLKFQCQALVEIACDQEKVGTTKTFPLKRKRRALGVASQVAVINKENN